MNTFSKIHKRFSERLRNSRVLTTPEEFLGENFESVLNFWLILDDLSEDQLRVVKERYDAFYNENYSEWYKALNLANVASGGVVGRYYAYNAYNAGLSAWYVINSYVACPATRELIGMHNILEAQYPLTFFPMILEVL